MDSRILRPALMLACFLLVSCGGKEKEPQTGSGTLRNIVLSINGRSVPPVSQVSRPVNPSPYLVSPPLAGSSSSSVSSTSPLVVRPAVSVPPASSSSVGGGVLAAVPGTPERCIKKIGLRGDYILDPSDPAFDPLRTGVPPYADCWQYYRVSLTPALSSSSVSSALATPQASSSSVSSGMQYGPERNPFLSPAPVTNIQVVPSPSQPAVPSPSSVPAIHGAPTKMPTQNELQEGFVSSLTASLEREGQTPVPVVSSSSSSSGVVSPIQGFFSSFFSGM
jgi:hypothetical protein